MKKIAKWTVVVAALAFAASAFAASAFAAGLDGTYSFSARTKAGSPDMQGWQGTMTIKGNEIVRTYKAPDGKQEKSYTSTFKQDGNLYVLKHTKAYKPEYVGNEFKNKIVVNGNTLTMEAEDGKSFKEVWTKK